MLPIQLERKLDLPLTRLRRAGELAGGRNHIARPVKDLDLRLLVIGLVQRIERFAAELNRVSLGDAKALRAYLRDGNWGGLYQRSDDEMTKIWQVAIEETRALLEKGWVE